MSDKPELVTPPQTDALPSGYQLYSFRLVKILGRGGFGITYRAVDTRRGGLVAIKEFMPTVFAGRDGVTVRPFSAEAKQHFDRFLQRFFDEATTLLRFGHLDNIVNVRSYFEANGTGYIVMDFETGPSLDRLMTSLGRPTTEAETKAILVPLLDGLEKVHETGFLHRDIKPQNIIVRADGSPVLIDFGSARIAAGEVVEQTMTAFVSAGYTPWEQYSRDGHQGPWSDLYALGATAYRMLTGNKPPDGLQRRLFGDRYISATQAVPPGRYTPGFLEAVDWVLRVEPEQRPQNAAEWRHAFTTEGLTVESRLPAKQGSTTSEEVTEPDPTAVPVPLPITVAKAAEAGTEMLTTTKSRCTANTLVLSTPTVLTALRLPVRQIIGKWPQPLSVFRDFCADGRECPECPEMVVIPKGSFVMGSPAKEPERLSQEGPQHPVTIGADFAVGRYAVTFAEWDACVADGGSEGYLPSDADWGRGRRPVINVSWNDAQAYVQWLSRKTGKLYRLLTEAEWEYAARAGTTSPFWWGSTITPKQANYNGTYTYNGGSPGIYRQKTVEVGSFRPNLFGLYEMAGNVWQWLEDSYHNGYVGAPNDGTAWISGDSTSSRIMRGGSWHHVASGLRSAYRFSGAPTVRSGDIGFRVARALI